ncbi:MAG: AlkA N-terminal domain-containing protein [Bryobacteraceae bacterium]
MPPLDPDVCYRALAARDARFDGRFFTGVRTTGIFCRPVCPANTPKAANCRFFHSSAAAIAAGFRPCLRCRPEWAPETFDALSTARTVRRALDLIDTGALDQAAAPDLAARLGIGDRHLRRLFRDTLGASPREVATTRRLLFARRLLTSTSLPVSAIAYESGFSSLRRFNEAFRANMNCTPSDLRKGNRPAAPPGILLHLPFTPPYDWDGIIAFLAPRAIPGLETVEPHRYHRTFRIGSAQGSVEVRRPQGAFLPVAVDLPEARGLRDIIRRLSHLFDLNANPELIAQHLGGLSVTPGLRVPGAWDSFELAVRAVLGQQVSVKGATTLAARIAAAYGELHAFPTPETLAEADFAAIGLTAARAATLRGLASAVATGGLDFTRPDCLDRLLTLPGIGPWTAQYIAMRALREPDAFPAGDLGLRKALGSDGKPATEREAEQTAEQWRPWRAYAAFQLWRSL